VPRESSRIRGIFLGSDEDLVPGNSSMLDGTPTRAVFNK
jgi:hypothetical protein